MSKVNFEFSAGGVVLEDKKLLLIRVKNLKGETVWAFPKGHIEKSSKETAQIAALREVKEETGYSCEIIQALDEVVYWFKEKDKLIKKTVKWFLMKPLNRVTEIPEGKSHRDEQLEVEEIKWVDIDKVDELLSYKSDRNMVETVLQRVYLAEKVGLSDILGREVKS